MTDLWCSPYQPGDEAAFERRPDMAEEHAVNGWDWSGGPPPGRTWTLMRSTGEIVGVAGLYDHGEGVLEAWSSLGPLRLRDWPTALWLAGKRLEGAGGARVIAACRKAHGGARRCLERLGFAAISEGEDERLPGVAIRYMQRAL